MASRMNSFQYPTIFSPALRQKSFNYENKQITSDQFGTPLEKLLCHRPSIAAAMLGSWDTPNNPAPVINRLRSSLSQSEIKPIPILKQKPPQTPLSTKRLCQSTKLRRRNAMTPGQIKSAKSRKWGLSPTPSTSTKKVECLVIPNPSFSTPPRERKSSMKRTRSKAEFVYYPYAGQDLRNRSTRHEPEENLQKNKGTKSKSKSFFRQLWSKLKKRNAGRKEFENKEVLESKDFVLVWHATPIRRVPRAFSSSGLEQYQLSPAPKRFLKRSITETRVEESDISTDSYSLRQLLLSKQFSKDFRNFLVGEFSEENLDFWFECEAFKVKKIEKLNKCAWNVYETYLRPGSLKEVNVNANTRAKVERELYRPHKEMFDEAQDQAYRLMQNDSFPRFLEVFKF